MGGKRKGRESKGLEGEEDNMADGGYRSSSNNSEHGNVDSNAKRQLLPSMIKNKVKRSAVHAKLKHQKKLEKHKKIKARDAAEKRALELGEELPAKKIPHTIENTRELDDTICKPDDDEVNLSLLPMDMQLSR